ncbi:DNA cytosine methyltransferase [Paenibacillus typhae]|uniref:Cytosine-specific methyltransferase n=1 Tax=Paenibacillus typhae TaxID=1174501 RepID=A0A1G8MMC1_9BACL|nr:DNA cytosine methyltransferase [Paenibacillus typhae]SDI69148.1 DNA (cytosine-5)-methyltransferase 1 [Paenibacillus typhae]
MEVISRGRGKAKPAPNMSKDEVKKILIEKIYQESNHIINDEDDLFYEYLDYKDDKMNLVSLFSGCGGLDLGFELAGLYASIGKERALRAYKSKETYNEIRKESIFHTIYTNDLFEEANDTYRANSPVGIIQHRKDIRKVKRFPKSDIVIGGFPCPGFSEAGPRLIDDERNFLYIHFIRCLMQTKPAFFVAENVKGMLTLGNGEVIKQIIEDFSSAGYNVTHKLLNARDYGAPQTRQRVILVGTRVDINYKYVFPEPTHGSGKLPYVTLKDAIGDLSENPGPYFTGSFSSMYLSRNRKKEWTDQSFTIQASGRQAPLHPSGPKMVKLSKDKWELPGMEDLNRRLSVKEIARIQTFPDWYSFKTSEKPINESAKLDLIYKQIGNAVPVLLARAIAQPIADWVINNLNEAKGTDNISLSLV